MPLDYRDPCADLPRLREAYLKLIAGEHTAVVEFEVGGGTRRRVEYHRGDSEALKTEIARLELLCAGQKPARVIRFQTQKGV
jgi:hypothetical protein